MHKCRLCSEKLTKLLVVYYNIIINKGFYLSRWLQVLDVMLKKGKGLVLDKLRTIQLIEADLQLLIWIFITLRNTDSIERDK